jgi:phosphohistidine phosphatase
MRLYLVQHGDALPKEVDPDRPLSEKGRADVQCLASFLKGRMRVSRVVQSGKTRAHQTAEILASALAPGRGIEVISGIDPLDPPEPIAREIQNWTEDTLMAGHEPFMGKLVTRLINEREEPLIVSFLPGTVVCLERQEEDGRWILLWMLRPELLSD